ncbi:enoyl-CoA hydratase/isomerase family protein [Inhella proteolytica]|uniref:Enoyl-CoA hydratase/isomerase family protein n=1 Tax=Inhella proteolytica TaxID=2795029 RepID=A0A931J8G7_9BURK|nr:enoyl-CoA hydratase/isomerase family protein [Inhella proteolytica]MBH9579494.1 enoyl-CoA hydratase/isomerase family protein [Inhella proteolytica]
MQPSESPDLRVEGALATITLRRPKQANRLELDDLAALEAHMQALRGAEAVRVVVLQAEGRHFCSGFHIDAVPGVDAPALFERLCDAWECLPQITVAALHAGLWGGATDLALASDFRFGTRECVIAVPAARLGLHYHLGGMRRLVTRLGLGPAKRLLLGGQTLDAKEMLRIGFLDELVADEPALRALIARCSREIATLAPLALRGMKLHLNRIAANTIVLDDLLADQQRCLQSGDLLEGVRAWAERRPPCFEGS